jgi:hypothetical protein
MMAPIGPREKPGPKITPGFEGAVWDSLMICELPPPNSFIVKVLVSVVFSYETIRVTAQRLQRSSEWADFSGVQKLGFSDGLNDTFDFSSSRDSF